MNAKLFIDRPAHGYNDSIYDEVKSFAQPAHFHAIVVNQWEELTDLPSRVSVSPARQRCVAEFFYGSDQFRYLPEDYLRYDIFTGGSVRITDADIATILRWKRARRIYIESNVAVAYRLAEHVDALKQMRVEWLVLEQKETRKRLDPNILLDNLKQLTHLSISNVVHKYIDRVAIEEAPQAVNRYNESSFEMYNFKAIDAPSMEDYMSAANARCQYQKNGKYFYLLA